MTGRLVLVATPIGNLGDVTRRATEALAGADLIYCEDTRTTRRLLSALHVPAGGRLRALHEHNEASLCAEVVERVAGGETVVLATDAGTPTVSDPGGRVVAAVAAAGLEVTTTPGPSAVVAALSVSGLATDRFCFEGFLPRKAGERRQRIEALLDEARTAVLYESPQRLAATLAELAGVLGPRRAVVARELTKVHEEVARGSLDELGERYADAEVRGECVIVIEGASPPPPVADDELRRAVAGALGSGLSVRAAAEAVAGSLGVSRRRAYEEALAQREEN